MKQTAIILAGGLGTRLSNIFPDCPKALVPVAGKPFLHWLILLLKKNSINEIIISTGYLAEKIEQFLIKNKQYNIKISSVKEPHPMGTAGGALFAVNSAHVKSDHIYIFNGDSLLMDDYEKDLNPSLVNIWARYEEDASRYGSLNISDDGFLINFNEKVLGSGFINTGIYFFPKQILNRFPETQLSFEYDIFPELLKQNIKIQVNKTKGSFIDIGTEMSYKNASSFINENKFFFESEK